MERSEQAWRDIAKAIRELEAYKTAEQLVSCLPEAGRDVERQRIVRLILNSQNGYNPQSGTMEKK